MKSPTLLILLAISPALFAEDRRGDNADAPPSSPEEQLGKFHVPPGFEVQLVAAEPEIQKPLSLNFDAAGRLWATGTSLYPWPAATDARGQSIPGFEKGWKDMADACRVGEAAPTPPPIGKDTLRVLSDFGPDGRARKIATFADGLNIPTGVQPLPRKPGAKGDRAIVFSIPSIWRMTDADGDGHADEREPLYEGFGYTDTHGMSSNYLHWIDGWIYGCHGFKNHSEVKDRTGRVTVFDSGNTYRFRPDGSQIEYYTRGQTNPYGLTVDPLGNFFSADSHSKPIMLLLRGGHYHGIGKEHDGLGFAPTITDDDHGSSAIAGIACYADDKFPEEYRGNFFNGNPVTRRINRDRLEWNGATPRAIRMPDFLTCDDPWFRPVQVKLGPDGAFWIADFYTPIIGHYEVPLTDRRRDPKHGRIWRVVWRGADTVSGTPKRPANLLKLSAEALTRKLGDTNLLVRTQATHELVERIGKSALPALNRVLDPLSTGLQRNALARAHALIAFQRIAQPQPGSAEDERFQAARWEGDELSRIFALKFTAEDHAWTNPDFAAIQHALTNSRSPLIRRAAWEAFFRAPPDIAFGDVAAWAGELDRDDAMLKQQAKIALREFFQRPYAFNELGTPNEVATATILESLLAVPTPEAAEHLLAELQRSGFRMPHAIDYVRHAALHLPPEKVSDLVAFAKAQKRIPPLIRLAAADALMGVVRTRGLTLPPVSTEWMEKTILHALRNGSGALLEAAIDAVRKISSDAKREPLARIASDTTQPGARRAAALEALQNLPGASAYSTRALEDPSSLGLRKKAAEYLGAHAATDEAACGALLGTLPTAPAELATVIAVALARTDTSCARLLDLIASGKASATLLRAKLVAATVARRSRALQDRVTALTRDLPPEDARLDKVIAERTQSFREAKPDSGRGAQVFQQHCAVCHRFRNAGGNVGPNLDGVAARGAQRLIEDILDPQRNVDPAFRLTSIETHDGQIIVGGNMREEGDAITLTDATGKDATFTADSIQTRTTSPFSLMPALFETQIALPDFHDLVTYLLRSGTQD